MRLHRINLSVGTAGYLTDQGLGGQWNPRGRAGWFIVELISVEVMDNHGHHLLLSISTIPGDTSLCDNQRNSGYFEQEIQKLGAWVDDLTLELEREIKKIDRDIKEVRCAVVISPVMEEKLSWQEEWFVLWTISWKPTSTADQGTHVVYR